MKLKKAFTVVVEVFVDQTDSTQFVVRNPNGQPIEVVSTPVELQSLFSGLSKTESPEGK